MPKALFTDLCEVEMHAGPFHIQVESLTSVVLFSFQVVRSLRFFDLKNSRFPVSFTMLSLKLFHICLVLAKLIVLSGVMSAASVHNPIIRAGLALSHQTTERKPGPALLLSLQRSRAHRANTLESLDKRGYDNHVLNDGWSMRFLRIDLGLPVSIASALLEDFYERVLERVHGYVTTIAPLKAVSIGILDLHLEFTCNSAEISWEFIKAFVTAMLNATKRGFTGNFKALAPLQLTSKRSLSCFCTVASRMVGTLLSIKAAEPSSANAPMMSPIEFTFASLRGTSSR
ncbi:MAG: hypothetical protein Q9161_008957 [Pseudevernia consocians]